MLTPLRTDITLASPIYEIPFEVPNLSFINVDFYPLERNLINAEVGDWMCRINNIPLTMSNRYFA